jgi:hypothetical protein
LASIVKAHRVWRQRGVETAIDGERQRGGKRHVGVQHARLAGDAMHRGVDEHRGGLDLALPGQPLAVLVDQHDVVFAHLAPQQAARIQQEATRMVGQFDAEVVADAFAEAMVRGRTQRQAQVGAQTAHHVGLVVDEMSVLHGPQYRARGPGRRTGALLLKWRPG